LVTLYVVPNIDWVKKITLWTITDTVPMSMKPECNNFDTDEEPIQWLYGLSQILFQS